MTDQDIQKILEEIGLTNSESKIYLTLLEQGSSLAGTISRNTGIHRRSVYDGIERLIQKGLVSYIKKNNRKYFEAADPERLMEILQKKEEDVKEMLPRLKLMQKMSSQKNETLFFRGKKGMKTAFEDQLEAKEILSFGADPAEGVLPYYLPHFHRKLSNKGIRTKKVTNEKDKEKNKEKRPLSENRFVDEDIKSKTEVNIYGRNVSIMVWKDDPIAIIIREKEVAEGFRNYFKLVWEAARKKDSKGKARRKKR